MTEEQRTLARHALGLDTRSHSYRNRYFANPNSAKAHLWNEMVADNDALRVPEYDTQATDFYCLTRQGALRALNSGETLDAEDFPFPLQGETP